MAATETITSIILIKLIRVSLGTVRHPRRFKIVVIDIFFFQAEDGIRDWSVTGVQTCALPISRPRCAGGRCRQMSHGQGERTETNRGSFLGWFGLPEIVSARRDACSAHAVPGRAKKHWSFEIGRASCRERG